MKYTKDMLPDGTIYESYEGEVSEILELINSQPKELKLNEGAAFDMPGVDVDKIAAEIGDRMKTATLNI